MAVIKFIVLLIIWLIILFFLNLGFFSTILLIIVYLYVLSFFDHLKQAWQNFSISATPHKREFIKVDENHAMIADWEYFPELDNKLQALEFQRLGYILSPKEDSLSIVYLNPISQIVCMIVPIPNKPKNTTLNIDFIKFLPNGHTIELVHSFLPKYFSYPKEDFYRTTQKFDVAFLYHLFAKKVESMPTPYQLATLDDILTLLKNKQEEILAYMLEQGDLKKEVDKNNNHRLTPKALKKVALQTFPFGIMQGINEEKRFQNMFNE